MKEILIVAGEVSGDHHGASLLNELKKLDGGYHFFGIGGDELTFQGMEVLFHIRDMAFLGVAEIIRHLPFIKKVKDSLLSAALTRKPVCAILIDYPGFNIRLAKALHGLNIPVLYYISPQVWAWGSGRVKKIKKYVKQMIVLFPFEKKFYQKFDINAEYVGHPLVDKHQSFLPKAIKKIETDHIKLGLLPGSRKQEVNYLLPKMVETARILIQRQKIKKAEIVKVAHLPMSIYTKIIDAEHSSITIVEKELGEILPQYDAVMVASGTATLEAGYFGVPMLIVYHVNPLTYGLGRLLVKVPFIGLVNIVAEKQVASELIQKDFTVERAVRHIEKMIAPSENLRIREELNLIQKNLGLPGASQRAAQCIHGFIQQLT